MLSLSLLPTVCVVLCFYCNCHTCILFSIDLLIIINVYLYSILDILTTAPLMPSSIFSSYPIYSCDLFSWMHTEWASLKAACNEPEFHCQWLLYCNFAHDKYRAWSLKLDSQLTSSSGHHDRLFNISWQSIKQLWRFFILEVERVDRRSHAWSVAEHIWKMEYMKMIFFLYESQRLFSND